MEALGGRLHDVNAKGEATAMDFNVTAKNTTAQLVTTVMTLELIDSTGAATPLETEFAYDPADPFAVSATFPNPHEWLRPGMFARVRVRVASLPDAMLIPQKAVQEVLDKSFVSVVDADGKVERRAVVLGARHGDEIVVKEGLQDQDRVIVEGHHKVRPGVQVKAVALADSPAGDAAASPSTSG